MYVPYWVYDVTVNSKCSAKVSRTDADPRDNGRAATENWLNVDTSYMHVHPKLMVSHPRFLTPPILHILMMIDLRSSAGLRASINGIGRAVGLETG
jgi:hypothetical protein